MRFQAQHSAAVDVERQLGMKMDIVMRRRSDSRPLAIIDTKYKVPERTASNADVYQVHAYAAHQGASEAILAYPRELQHPLDTAWRHSDVRVRTAVFGIDGDLEVAGMGFDAKLKTAVLGRPSRT